MGKAWQSTFAGKKSQETHQQEMELCQVLLVLTSRVAKLACVFSHWRKIINHAQEICVWEEGTKKANKLVSNDG